MVMLLVIAMMAGCGTKTANTDNVLTCGVTIFENMNEQLEDGTWTGVETEFAQAVGKKLDMDVEFQIIDWGQKYNELNSGAIDCVWNGFTANSSDDGIKRSDLVDFSYGYMLNQQCIVTKAANVDAFKTEADLKGKTACVEGGSAGAAYAESVTDADKIFSTTAQINAFTEVKSGAVDFIVVDILLAQNICGNGDYADLAIVDAIELEADGTLMELAKKYGFENVLKITENIE